MELIAVSYDPQPMLMNCAVFFTPLYRACRPPFDHKILNYEEPSQYGKILTYYRAVVGCPAVSALFIQAQLTVMIPSHQERGVWCIQTSSKF